MGRTISLRSGTLRLDSLRPFTYVDIFENLVIFTLSIIGGSSNGRTPDFESVNWGSTPCPPATKTATRPLGFVVVFVGTGRRIMRTERSEGAGVACFQLLMSMANLQMKDMLPTPCPPARTISLLVPTA